MSSSLLSKEKTVSSSNEFGLTDKQRSHFLHGIANGTPDHTLLTLWKERNHPENNGFAIWQQIKNSKLYQYFIQKEQEEVFDRCGEEIAQLIKQAGHIVLYACGDSLSDIELFRRLKNKGLISNRDVQRVKLYMYDVTSDITNEAAANRKKFLVDECGAGSEDKLSVITLPRDRNEKRKEKILGEIDLGHNKEVFVLSTGFTYSNLIDDEPQRFFNFRDDAHTHVLVTHFNELTEENTDITLAAYGKKITTTDADSHELDQDDFDRIHELVTAEVTGALQALGVAQEDLHKIQVDCDVEENGTGEVIYEGFTVSENISVSVGGTTYEFVPGKLYRLFPSKRIKRSNGIQEAVEGYPIRGRVLKSSEQIGGEVIGASIIEVHGKDLERERQAKEVQARLTDVLEKRKRTRKLLRWSLAILAFGGFSYLGIKKLDNEQKTIEFYTQKDLTDLFLIKGYSAAEVEKYVERFEQLIDRLVAMLQTINSTGCKELDRPSSGKDVNIFHEKMLRIFVKQHLGELDPDHIDALLGKGANIGVLFLDFLATSRSELIGDVDIKNALLSETSHEIVRSTIELLQDSSTRHEIAEEMIRFQEKMRTVSVGSKYTRSYYDFTFFDAQGTNWHFYTYPYKDRMITLLSDEYGLPWSQRFQKTSELLGFSDQYRHLSTK